MVSLTGLEEELFLDKIVLQLLEVKSYSIYTVILFIPEEQL